MTWQSDAEDRIIWSVCVGGSRCNRERHLQKVVFELDLEGWQRWSVVDDKYTPSLGKAIKA